MSGWFARLEAKHGFKLVVVAVSRISTDHQDERSLDDQLAKLKELVESLYDGEIEWIVIASRGSGEHLDRKEIYDLEVHIESGRIDLVIAEDLARICRRKRAYDLCELCVDNNVRLIAVNDRVDTSMDGWEDSAFISTWHHERSNRDTSERIKRSLRNRFLQGGVCQSFPAGYIKPPDTTSDADVRKDPEAEPVYDEWFGRLERGDSFAEIADWLNSIRFPTGPFCRQTEWNGQLVSRATRNPILKGVRQRNRRISRRVNKTGRHRSEKAPESEHLNRPVPHLAFIAPERYDRVVAMVIQRNSHFARRCDNGHDPRAGVPRKRTRWPGQHIYCGICGRAYVYGGHGQAKHLMCSGSSRYACWNGISIGGPLAARKMADAILAAIETVPEYDDTFLSTINEEAARLDSDRNRKRSELERNATAIDRQIDNLVVFIREGDQSPRVRDELERLESERRHVTSCLQDLDNQPNESIVIPPLSELKLMAREAFGELAVDDPDFGRLMRLLIPKIVVFPVRLCDGKQIVMRAKFRLQFSRLLPEKRRQDVLLKPLEQILSVDLFDHPQREAHRRTIVGMRAGGSTETDAADVCGITRTAAQNAMRLQRIMRQLNLDDPYIQVTEPLAGCKKPRRHLHKRYRFEPRDDAGQY